MEYYCAVDSNGVRHDIDQRPELRSGSVEYIAPQEYMVSSQEAERAYRTALMSSDRSCTQMLISCCKLRSHPWESMGTSIDAFGRRLSLPV